MEESHARDGAVSAGELDSPSCATTPLYARGAAGSMPSQRDAHRQCARQTSVLAVRGPHLKLAAEHPTPTVSHRGALPASTTWRTWCADTPRCWRPRSWWPIRMPPPYCSSHYRRQRRDPLQVVTTRERLTVRGSLPGRVATPTTLRTGLVRTRRLSLIARRDLVEGDDRDGCDGPPRWTRPPHHLGSQPDGDACRSDIRVVDESTVSLIGGWVLL